MNIAIIGSGPTGSLAALSLANLGCRVDLYERLSDDELINKNRTYALTHSTRRILQRLKIWNEIEFDLVPFHHLNVIDSDINKRVSFEIFDLGKFNLTHASIGWIVEHEKIMQSILNIINRNNNINKIPTSVIRNSNNYDLILVSDGSNSITKKNLNIPFLRFNYDQVCITAKVLLRGAKSNEAFEILTPEGPFAVLPLGNDLFQIVCSLSISKASFLNDLPGFLFLDYLASILPSGIQPDSIIDEPQSYPIKFILNYSFFSGKYIFLGETAHALHPVGGQGLNLCWRDVESLTKIISISFFRKNTIIIPLVYFLYRLVDVLSISLITDILVRYSRSNYRILIWPKYLIFYMLSKLPFLRRCVLSMFTNGL